MKVNQNYGLVLVGCGHIGAAHLEDIYFRDNVQIVGVVDSNEQLAAMFCKKYNALSYSTDYRDYLDDERVNIVIIATYVATHLQILKDCVAKGKHVLCEKPIASSYEEAMEFVKVVKGASSKVLVGHILRHNDTYCRVAEMIQNGSIGKPIVMRMTQNHHTMNWPRYRRLLEDCSPIVDCGVHYIDVMQWFTGEKIVSVSGIGAVLDGDVPKNSYNYGMFTATLSGGSVGYYEAGWGNTVSAENVKEFIGPKGRIKLILAPDRTANREEGDLIEFYDGITKEYIQINVAAKYKSMWHQLQTLIDMIENDFNGNPTIDDVLSVVRVSFAADKAIRERKMITLDHDTQKIVKNMPY